jgi:hypothetical protein
MTKLARKGTLVFGLLLLLGGVAGVGLQAVFWGMNFEVIYAATAFETACGFGLAPCSLALGFALFSFAWFSPPQPQPIDRSRRIYAAVCMCIVTLCVLSAILGSRKAWDYRIKLMESGKVQSIPR